MTEDRIYLVGFMGAGKSRVGRSLATRLNWSFVDLDGEIEAAEKMSVRDIFRREGEPRFRELEREHLQRISSRTQVVVALGGGAYLDPDNRRLANSSGVTVWLKVSFANVLHRVTMDGSRPMFANPEQAERLYEQRLPYYGLAAIHMITDQKEPDAIARDIAEKLNPS